MGLERTPKFTEEVESVRRMPQDTEYETADKREQAKLLRMEALFDNARCAEAAITLLEENPEITKDEIEEKLTNDRSFSIVHPQTVEIFIENLIASKRKVMAARDFYLKFGKDADLPGVFYRSLVPEGMDKKAAGNLTLDWHYPLAVTLFVAEKGDFAKIDNRTNVGGFFEARRAARSREGDLYTEFPLIVNRGDPNTQGGVVNTHERGHAENSVLKRTLREAEMKIVWGKMFNDFGKEAEIGERVAKAVETEGQNALKNKDVKMVVAHALSCAKDEVLAEYKEKNKISERHVGTLLTRGGLYDYIKNYWKISDESAAYYLLWKNYSDRLVQACDSVKDVLNSYERIGLKKRIKRMRWVLAQIPLQRWNTVMIDSGFQEEAEWIGRTDVLLNDYRKAGMNNVEPERAALIRELFKGGKIHDHEDKPLMPFFREWDKRWQELDKKDEERRLMIWEDVETMNDNLINDLKSGKINIYGVPDRLRRFYDKRCGAYYLMPDPGFIEWYLEDKGWIKPKKTA